MKTLVPFNFSNLIHNRIIRTRNIFYHNRNRYFRFIDPSSTLRTIKSPRF